MNPPKTDEELSARLRAFVVDRLQYLQPHNLPLLPEQQASFINTTLYLAKELYESEPFLRARK